MANLRNFIWSGSHDGMPLDLYLNRFPSIGTGVLRQAQPLRLVVDGEVSVLGTTYRGSIDIRMPDEASAGQCTVVVNGQTRDGCAYHVEGDTLVIQVADRTVRLSAGDKQWTWIGVSGVPAYVGVWPASSSVALTDADFAAAPAPVEPAPV